jgi:low molecular weight protein-tyrosine phosphatase
MLMINVLFVCLGNLCRSPLAQGILEAKIIERQLQHEISVDSCGTASFAIGKSPDPRAISAGERAGYEISGQKARQISVEDFRKFGYIAPMDNINLMNVRTLAPKDYSGEMRLFRSFAQRGGDLQIADPYHKDQARFDAVIPELELAAEGMLEYLIQKL